MARRGQSCSTTPAHSMRKTKGAALPSITGTSGPFNSITALSMPQPLSAAIRCSMVATWLPRESTRLVQSGVSTRILPKRLDLSAAIGIAAAKNNTGVRLCRVEGHGDLDTGMQGDARAIDGILESPSWRTVFASETPPFAIISVSVLKL